MPQQAIIVVSAHNESDYLVELLHVGINSFLIKPIKHEQLINTLYKVSNILRNERLVAQHYKKIEQLNAELSLQSETLKQMNNELHDKNSALEKSMRIIEGIHQKEQIKHSAYNLNTASTPSVDSPVQTDDDSISKSVLYLEDIGDIISIISLEYQYKNIGDDSLKELSKAVYSYTQSLPQLKEYEMIKTSLQSLADVIAGRPKCNTLQELERIFNMLESFFFIYSKWQKEWKNIDECVFESFCNSIEGEINTLIDVWECRI
jgi:YesN/AraC family two-component response regulator